MKPIARHVSPSVLAFVLAALPLAAPSRAHADEPARRAQPSEEAEAREAMQRGILLFGKGDAEGALREYERAMRLVPAANLPYRYAAEAKLSLGRVREAIADLKTYLEKNPQVSDAAAVSARIAELEARASRGDLAISATVEGATAAVDHEPKVRLPHTMALTAGDHVVVVEKTGYVTVEQKVRVTAGTRDTLVVSLVPVAERPAPRPEAPVRTAWPVVGITALAVGGATLLAGGLVDVTALGAKRDELTRAADAGDPRLVEIQDEARSLRTGVQVTYVVGLVTAAAGAAIWLFAPRTSRAHRESLARPFTVVF